MLFHCALLTSLCWWTAYGAPVVERDIAGYSTATNCTLDSPWIVTGLLAYNYTYDVANGNFSNIIGITVNTSVSNQIYYSSTVNDSTIFTFYPCGTTSTLTYPETIPHDPVKAVYGHIIQNGTSSEQCLKMNNALSIPLTASVDDCPKSAFTEPAYGWFTFFGGNSPTLNPMTTGHGSNSSDLFSVSDRNAYNVSLTNGSTEGAVYFNRFGTPLTFIPLDQVSPN